MHLIGPSLFMITVENIDPIAANKYITAIAQKPSLPRSSSSSAYDCKFWAELKATNRMRKFMLQWVACQMFLRFSGLIFKNLYT